MVVLFRFLPYLFLTRPTREISAVNDKLLIARLGGVVVCIWALLFFFVSPATSSNFFPNLSQAHLESGKAFLNKGEMDRAINEFRVTIQLHPGNAAAHTNLGYALGRKGDLNGAILAYREAVRLQL